jgi:hypothetical protein
MVPEIKQELLSLQAAFQSWLSFYYYNQDWLLDLLSLNPVPFVWNCLFIHPLMQSGVLNVGGE